MDEVLDQAILAHPAAWTFVVVLVLAANNWLLRWSIGRNICTLDAELERLRASYKELEGRLNGIERCSVELQGEVKLSTNQVASHLASEEKTVWPAIEKALAWISKLHERLDAMHDEDVEAHAMIGERLSRLETLVTEGPPTGRRTGAKRQR